VSEQGPPGFGDPDSIRATGEAAQQAVSELEKLTAEVTANVRDRVPDAWSGSAGTAAGVRWEDVNTSLAGLGSPVDAYRRRMADAATTVSQAREALDVARSFASRNNLHVNADLSVTALNPSDPNAPSLATACQQMLIKARAVADNAQQQIRTANQTLGTAFTHNLEQLWVIAQALVPGPKTRPKSSVKEEETAASGRTRLNEALKGRLSDRINALDDEELMARLHGIDPTRPGAAAQLKQLEFQVGNREAYVEETPQHLDTGHDLTVKDTPGGPQPAPLERGNFVHDYAEQLRPAIDPGPNGIPAKYADDVAAGRVTSIANLPDGLAKEVELGDTARVDRVGGVIYDIKPNTESEIDSGLSRLQEYTILANQQGFQGRTDWTGVVVVYDAQKAASFLPPR
jgi:hypothetical protein